MPLAGEWWETKMRYLLCAVLFAAQAAFASQSIRVIDGDTLELDSQRIRINGIDAPEVGQKCGNWSCDEAATDRLWALLAGAHVECSAHGSDRYGRIIATCYANGVDVGAQLVSEGLAWAFVRYDDVYAPLEASARQASLGVWRGSPVAPWDYRAGRWDDASRSGCPIKGNISNNGERIYHMPWSPWYAKTKINESNGERWFCDEAEALAAGWRAARTR